MRLRAIAATLLLLLGMPALASAQEQEKPVTRILVLGDAIGGGLGAGLTRVAEASGEYEVSNRFNEESGLARPEVYDWTATVPKILGSNAYDVIVVMLGANDTQPIRYRLVVQRGSVDVVGPEAEPNPPEQLPSDPPPPPPLPLPPEAGELP